MRLPIALPLVFTFACAHQQKPVAATPTPPVVEAAPTPTPPVAEAKPAGCARDVDCRHGTICVDAACLDVNSAEAGCFHVAHFDLDRADLRDEDRKALERVGRCLKNAPDLLVDVEGHTDERGTMEYNIALGDRRAAAIVGYLASLGAPEDQVRPVSYGRLRPVCEGHEEPCWWRNRRAEVRKMSDTARRDFEQRRMH